MIYKKIFLKKDQRAFFASDFHYGHLNICKGTSEWPKQEGRIDKTRNFQTIEAMNFAIVDGINKTVGEDDYLIHLGDWSFGGINNIWNLRKQINCKNIIVVLGNHDEKIAANRELPNCTYGDLRAADIVRKEDFPADDDRSAKVEYLFESVHSYLELTVKHESGSKRTYNLFHYPITIANKAHHGRIHLYGHVHGNYRAKDRSMDVGIDATFNRIREYRPISEKEIEEYMQGRGYIALDHHTKNTN